MITKEKDCYQCQEVAHDHNSTIWRQSSRGPKLEVSLSKKLARSPSQQLIWVWSELWRSQVKGSQSKASTAKPQDPIWKITRAKKKDWRRGSSGRVHANQTLDTEFTRPQYYKIKIERKGLVSITIGKE
jgi:hypothetical protein